MSDYYFRIILKEGISLFELDDKKYKFSFKKEVLVIREINYNTNLLSNIKLLPEEEIYFR